MPGHRYLVEQSALETLLVLEDSQIARLIGAFELLAQNAAQPPDYYGLDITGRPICFAVTPGFVIGYAQDPATFTLYILRIEVVGFRL